MIARVDILATVPVGPEGTPRRLTRDTDIEAFIAESDVAELLIRAGLARATCICCGFVGENIVCAECEHEDRDSYEVTDG